MNKNVLSIAYCAKKEKVKRKGRRESNNQNKGSLRDYVRKKILINIFFFSL
ncbi:MAG: hypothetical protein KAJ79_05970 [Candidatus Omnitrophica bacterium]|nr:hypothetical protein [Candidatus Omnitrophota bacterium]